MSTMKENSVPVGDIVPLKGTPETHKRGGPKFTKMQRELVLAKVADMYMRGNGPSAIAREIGVTLQMAINYLKQLEKKWVESQIKDFDILKSRELTKLDNLERTYWESWENSLTDKTQTQTVIVPSKDKDGNESPRRQKQTVKKIESVGDPRFLDGVFRCIDRRIKLLGLDAAQQHVITSDGDENALSKRLAQYAVIFGPGIAANSPRPADYHSLDESVDSERSASEASGVLDADYELR